MPLEEEMMSAREVAKIFNMSEKTIRTHVRGVRVGRGYRYSRAHVMRAMSGQGHGPAPIPACDTPDHRGLALEAQRLWSSTSAERSATGRRICSAAPSPGS